MNGQTRRVDVTKQETLVVTLRYKLGLTGTKIGCDRAECGSCTVLLDGVPHYACSVLTHNVRGRQVMTVEGLEQPDGTLHPMQQAFHDNERVSEETEYPELKTKAALWEFDCAIRRLQEVADDA